MSTSSSIEEAGPSFPTQPPSTPENDNVMKAMRKKLFPEVDKEANEQESSVKELGLTVEGADESGPSSAPGTSDLEERLRATELQLASERSNSRLQVERITELAIGLKSKNETIAELRKQVQEMENKNMHLESEVKGLKSKTETLSSQVKEKKKVTAERKRDMHEMCSRIDNHAGAGSCPSTFRVDKNSVIVCMATDRFETLQRVMNASRELYSRHYPRTIVMNYGPEEIGSDLLDDLYEHGVPTMRLGKPWDVFHSGERPVMVVKGRKAEKMVHGESYPAMDSVDLVIYYYNAPKMNLTPHEFYKKLEFQGHVTVLIVDIKKDYDWIRELENVFKMYRVRRAKKLSHFLDTNVLATHGDT